ncbi:ATP-binding protein [Solicola sp. PLA-1-18]|uniref:sensor histidine kinase n=1 Tax=Solicola sp. PLA-1-18 TaxID=3380532 RepID=UPI003B81CE9E
MPTWRSTGSLARQILALQVVVVLLVVAGATALAYVDARRDADDQTAQRATAVAVGLADSPTVAQALTTADPSAVLQPYAERLRRDTDTDFVVVMDTDRVRFTHPTPANIGRRFVGNVAPALAGRTFTEEYVGTLGRSVRAVTPVEVDGEVVALVAVGVATDRVQQEVLARLPAIVVAGLAVLLLGVVGAWLISRRVRRQTHGLGGAEITRMYEYYDSVLHAVREGIVLLDRDDRVQLVNDEARSLLGLDADPLGTGLDGLALPDDLVRTMTADAGAEDEIHLVGERVLVVNQQVASWEGRALGRVVTLRDHTQLRQVAAELDTVKGLTESLRAQNHEASNRLHTVVSLIETGRPQDAVAFATRELELAQRLTDEVVAAVDEPVLAALLLGKTAQAAERGIELQITDDTHVSAVAISSREVVTILGNLIDNAMDAVHEADQRVVVVRVESDDLGFEATVEDSGPGITHEYREKAFERGWSTKRADDGSRRGLGLALVGQAVRRHGGSVSVHESALGGARFEVSIELAAAP